MNVYVSPLFLRLALVSLTAIGGFSFSADATPRRSDAQRTTPSFAVTGLTRLRADEPVCLVVRNPRGLELRHLNVEVRNVGNHPAADIIVYAELSDGIVIQLRGPTRLAPEQRGFYVLRSRIPLAREGPVRVVTRCGNCRL